MLVRRLARGETEHVDGFQKKGATEMLEFLLLAVAGAVLLTIVLAFAVFGEQAFAASPPQVRPRNGRERQLLSAHLGPGDRARDSAQEVAASELHASERSHTELLSARCAETDTRGAAQRSCGNWRLVRRSVPAAKRRPFL